MTDETEDKTEPWIKQHGVKYPYAYMSKAARSSAAKALGWRGYPSAALIAPDGTIVWSGHPASANGSLIKKHLAGADRTPVEVRRVSRTWPEEASKVVKELMQSDYAGAFKAAEKLDDQLKEQVVADLQAMVDNRAGKLKELFNKGDYLGFQMAWDQQGKAFKRLPVEDELEELEKRCKKDKEIKKVVKAQKMLYALEQSMQGSRTQEETTRLIAQIQSLVDDHPDTFAAAKGEKLIKQLQGSR